jgi:hypothetical protein
MNRKVLAIALIALGVSLLATGIIMLNLPSEENSADLIRHQMNEALDNATRFNVNDLSTLPNHFVGFDGQQYFQGSGFQLIGLQVAGVHSLSILQNENGTLVPLNQQSFLVSMGQELRVTIEANLTMHSQMIDRSRQIMHEFYPNDPNTAP